MSQRAMVGCSVFRIVHNKLRLIFKSERCVAFSGDREILVD